MDIDKLNKSLAKFDKPADMMFTAFNIFAATTTIAFVVIILLQVLISFF